MSIPIYVGFDQREAAVFHVFNQSLVETTSKPVAIHPLAKKQLNFDGQRDGTNEFIFSRYLVPYLQDYKGWAIFADGDMHLNANISELFDLRDDKYAVMVVKHDYKTAHSRKYRGSPIENDNIDYPRKNWSSVILFNCEHPANRILDREYISTADPRSIHRFSWLKDEEIGELPLEWNWLCTEYPKNPNAKLIHQTLGTPGFKYYSNCDSSDKWYHYLRRANEIVGEEPAEVMLRSLIKGRKNQTWKGEGSQG